MRTAHVTTAQTIRSALICHRYRPHAAIAILELVVSISGDARALSLKPFVLILFPLA